MLLGKGKPTNCYYRSSYHPSLLTKKAEAMLRGQEEGKRKAWPLLPTGSPRTMALGLFPLFLCRHFLSISLLLHSLLPLPFTHSVQPLATFLAGSLASQCPKAQLATEEMLHPSALFTQIEKTAVAPFTPTSKSTVLPVHQSYGKPQPCLASSPPAEASHSPAASNKNPGNMIIDCP